MDKLHKNLVVFMSLLLSTGLSFVMFFVFLVAFFNGFRVRVLVNEFGEAHVELVMLLVLMPFICFGTYLSYKNIGEIK
jgi:hypothetical protein